MAHNLNEVDGKIAFASTKTAWHGLGKIVDSPMTTKEAIQYGGLDYTVEKQPLYLGNESEVETHKATVRTDTNDILGIVGNGYQVVQNRDVFDFFDPLLDGMAKIETVGALGKGERIFVTAKMPHKICVGKDDLTEMYMLLTSSHDGSGAIVAGITPIRVVCQNTLSFAINRGLKNRIGVKHTTTAQQRLSQAGMIMRQSLEYQQTLDEAFNFLFKTKVDDSVAKGLIKEIFQKDAKDSTKMGNILETIETCYNAGVGQESIVGTAWGVFNGITHYLSHEKNYKTEESKFNSLLLGSGDSQKMTKRAFDVLIDYAK